MKNRFLLTVLILLCLSATCFAAAPHEDGNDLLKSAGQYYAVRRQSAAVTVTAPSGVTVEVHDTDGKTLSPVNGVYALNAGEVYFCRSTVGVYHAEKAFLATDGLTVVAPTPITEDWLNDLALYNSSNANSRVAYPADTTFTPSCHSYTVTISDFNTAVYAQATSDDKVTAIYRAQTTSAQTHGEEKTVEISQPVSAEGATNFLTRLIARSGYGTSLVIRVTREADGVTYYQDYSLQIVRALHLKALSASDENGTLTLQNAEGAVTVFHRETTDYAVTVERGATEIFLNAEFPNASGETDCCGGYFALVNGERYDELSETVLALSPVADAEVFTIEVQHTDTQSVTLRYTLTVNKTDPIPVAFRTEPENAVVYLTYDADGTRVSGTDGVYALIPDASYHYTVTCAGYRGVSAQFTAPSEAQTVDIALEEAPENDTLVQLSSEWAHQRLNAENNAVTDAPTPTEDGDAVLYWATKLGEGYDRNTCGAPILVDGYLYTYAESTVYKIDTVTGEIVASGSMERSSSYAVNTPTYADGMLFIGLSEGTVQAFDAATLQSLWVYHDDLGGQPNCPIIYHDGYIYTGFWVGESSKANYVCLSATDEFPDNAAEEKLASWKYTSLGGFYWAGAYVCDDYLLVGTEDGTETTGTAKLLSLDPLTGEVIDQTALPASGDIRSSVTADGGKFYFTGKGGYFYEASVSAQGKIETVRSLRLENGTATAAMSTSTPTVYNGRAYVGVCGENQFGAYSGHNITVIDIASWQIAYRAATKGYPQSSGVLTTAYEAESGYVYVYFFDNYTPSKLRMLRDRAGQTEPEPLGTETYLQNGVEQSYETAYTLFTPSGAQAQYCIGSPIIDEYGTIYFKNDSAYLMAVGSTIERLEIVSQPEKTDYLVGEVFDAEGLRVIAHYTNGAQRDVTQWLTWQETPLTSDDTDFVLTFPHVLYQDKDGASGVAYPEPFVTLRLTVSEESVLGDVNGDGVIDAADCARIMQYLNGMTELTAAQRAAADVDGDGTVGIADASLISKYCSGALDAFPSGSEKG